MNLKYVAAMVLDEAMNETDADESAFMEDPVVFAQAPAARPAKGRKRKIRAKSVFSDVRDALTGMTTLNFTVKIDTPKYGKTLGLDIPDDSSDVGLTGKAGVDETAQSVEADSNDEVISCVEDAGIEYAEGMQKFDVGGARMRCATPANRCRAKNPLTCRYHGIQVFKADIEGMIKAAFQRAGKQFNSELTVTMNHLEGGEGAAAGIVTLGVRVTVPEEDAELVRQGMRDFGNVPGVELVEGEDPGGQVDNLFDIDFDRLDPNQQARFRRDDLPEAAEAAAEETEQETFAERVNAEQGTAGERGQESEERDTQRPQQQGATQTEESAEGERDFNAEIAALQGQIDAVGQKIATDDQNLQFLNGMVQNAPNDAMRQMAQGMVDQAAAAKTDHEQERQRLDGQMETLQQERAAAEDAARQAEDQRRREEAERAEIDRQRGLLNQMAGEVMSFLGNATDPEIAEAERAHPGYSNGMRRLAELLRSGALNEMLGIGGGQNTNGQRTDAVTESTDPTITREWQTGGESNSDHSDISRAAEILSDDLGELGSIESLTQSYNNDRDDFYRTVGRTISNNGMSALERELGADNDLVRGIRSAIPHGGVENNSAAMAVPSTPVEHAAATVQAREAAVERPATPVASAYTAAGDGNSAKATAQVTDEMRNPLVAEFERAAAEKSRLFAALRERGVDANDRADGDAMKARRYSSYLGSLSHLIGRNGSRLEGKNAGQILEDAQNWVREAHGADRTLSDGTVQRGRETTKYKRAKDAARFIGSKLGANVSFDDETGNMSVEWTDRPEAVSVNFDYIQGVNQSGAAGGTGEASSVQAPQHAAVSEGASANETERSETRPQNTATAAAPAFEARNERAGRLNSALQNVRGERARNLLTRIRDRANA